MNHSRLRRLTQRLRTIASMRAVSRIGRMPPRLYRWAAAHHRTALSQILRGLCFGAGSSTCGLLLFWLQHRN
ncbi:hypothetical protein GCM10010278_71230 [Streptomyces melanogenes]|nr:hypothetical protein GCM10010278_71230 [Streptomyces melanogenes]